MTLTQMRSAVRTKLDESSATFWTDTDIDNALNEGLAELGDATEFEERNAPLTCGTGRGYYNLVTVMPLGFLGIRRVFNVTTSRWLTMASIRSMDTGYGRQWETHNGQPEQYWMRGHWWMGVWPKPSTDAAILRVYYIAVPETLTIDSDTPRNLQREFHEGIVDYALWDCLSQSRETQKAMRYWASYQRHEAKLLQFVRNRTAIAGVQTL